MQMKNKLIYITLTLAFVFFGMADLSAQNVRPESIHENMLLEAVSEYNARNLDASQAILKKIVEGVSFLNAKRYFDL